MYPNMEGGGNPVQSTTPTRGGPPAHFRGGRGMSQNTGLRGVRGGFAGRGRGMPIC